MLGDDSAGGDQESPGDQGDAAPRAVVYQDVLSILRFNFTTSGTWVHTVTDTGAPRLLLVFIIADAPSMIPTALTVDGDTLSLVTWQSAPSFGAISLFAQANPAPGPHSISVTLPQEVAGFGRALTLEHVSTDNWLASLRSGTHEDGSSLQVECGPRDLPLVIVSWGNDQSTSWGGDAIELWDDTNPGGGEALGSSAATARCSPVADFAWHLTSVDTQITGAYLGFAVRAADQ